MRWSRLRWTPHRDPANGGGGAELPRHRAAVFTRRVLRNAARVARWSLLRGLGIQVAYIII